MFRDHVGETPVRWKEVLAHTFEHLYFARLAGYRHAMDLEEECAERTSRLEREALRHMIEAYIEARRSMLAEATVVAVALSRRTVTDKHWFVLYYVPHTKRVADLMRKAGVAGTGMWLSAGSAVIRGALEAAMPDPVFAIRLDQAASRGLDSVLLPAAPQNYHVEYVGMMTDRRRERLAMLLKAAPSTVAADEIADGAVPGQFFAKLDIQAAYSRLTNNCGTVAAWLLDHPTNTCQVAGFGRVPDNLVGRSLAALEAVRY